MAFTPDGRLFVCEQGGRLRVIKNGTLLSTPFLTVPVHFIGERGLLGVAIDPDFQVNRYVYVYYTATSPNIHNRVSRFTASGDVAVGGSEFVLLDLDPLSAATNHNGGAMHFGADGKLYVAVGDNASSSTAPSLNSLFGKILRLNPDGTIPTDNPFYGTASGNRRSIWAMGLRNPFTFAFQPTTGRMFINDVGEQNWEEINDGIAGSNYGWPNTEGYTSDPRYRSPLHAYGHGFTSTTGCAITGGAFYNPLTGQFPGDYVGDYFFADYCTGWIRRFDPSANTVHDFVAGAASPVDLKVADDGSLYYLARDDGAVYKVEFVAGSGPQITSHPSNQTAGPGETAIFTVTASGTPSLQYQWQKNGLDIAGATAATYTTPPLQQSDDGARFRAVVTNAFGSTTSDEAVLEVTANTSPVATIDEPVAGALYAAGEVITYGGTGADAEDGSLPPSAFTWQVDFHHDTHTHPFIPATSGAEGGSFTVPATGHTEANVWYRLYLTVRDTGGRSDTTYVDLRPRKSQITLATNPAGLRITLDGQPASTPLVFDGVVGVTRSLGVVSPQVLNGQTWEFVSWSDGGAAAHDISTPAIDTTYTAVFQAAAVPAGLVAAYGFNSASGTTAADGSGNGNNGTISGAAWTAQGRFGQALSFDGVDDWVTVSTASSLNLGTGMTLEAWVRPMWLSGWRTVLMREQSSDVAYALFAHDGTAGPVAQIVAGTSRRASSTTRLPLDTWTHLAVTYDGSQLRLFVNAVQVGSVAATAAIPASSSPLRIGGNAIWGEYFHGVIDEVRIYNRALSVGELSADMNTPVGSTPQPPADATPPSVSITAPSSGASLSGVVTVAASASDSVGVQSVQFLLDGANLGTADTADPYQVSWDTTTTTNGSKTLTAVARDAAGNSASTTVTVTVANAVAPPSTGLVAAYDFNENSGSTVIDRSGGGNAGTISGAAWTAAGRFGQALSFDGVDDWVTVADASSLDLTNGMTLEAWIRPTALGGWRTVMFKENPGGLAYALYADNGVSRPEGQAHIDGTDHGLQGTSAIPLNTWTHVAVTFSGTTLRLFVNGTEVDSLPVTGSMIATSGPLHIGGNAVWGEWFAGQVDEVRVYNRPLTQAEIQSDMNTPIGGTVPDPDPDPDPSPSPSPSGLVAAFGFGSGSGTVAPDASGNGNTGTISGAAWTAAGRFGQALSFDGVNDSVTVADAGSLDLTNGMTLEAWIRPTSFSGWRTVLLKESAGGLAYALYADNGSSRPEGQAHIGGVSRGVRGMSAIPLNAWTHMAVTFSGTTLRLYVNGAAVGSLAVTGSMVATSGPLRIGGNAVWGEWFFGQIDEVRIYNRPLTEAEIQSDMNTPVP